MTFEELIKKLKNETDNGVYEILRYHLEDFKKFKDITNEYEFINGILWGLYATNFISDHERKQLNRTTQNILNEWVYEFKEE